MKFQPDVNLVLSKNLNAVNVAEVGQQGYKVGPGINYMTDSISRAH